MNKSEVICKRCLKKFDYNSTYRLCDEGDNGETAICFPCLELTWRNIIEMCKEWEKKKEIKL